MSKVIIGNSERELEKADPQWINEQINRRREAGENVCVRVTIKKNGINLTFATPSCGGRGGGDNPQFNTQENECISLWNKFNLNTDDFASGKLVAFIKQIT